MQDTFFESVGDGVATTGDSEAFGRLVGAEAKVRNFEAASRHAFVADGQAYNWAIHKRWFREYVAVTDFIHVLGEVWLAASATGTRQAVRAALPCDDDRLAQHLAT